MNFLYTADLHLTSRDQDEYRWEIFPFLEKQIQNRGVDYLFILGDLTDRKDEHPSVLVNRLHKKLTRLAGMVGRKIVILKGNHDYIDEDKPFFRFLHGGCEGKILFITRPTEFGFFGTSFLAFPHTRSWRARIANFDLSKYDRVLIHQPVKGAIGENGVKVREGIKPRNLRGAKKVLAGDIHVPQDLGNLTYVGAPHPIRFGDNFAPRLLYEEAGRDKILNISRFTIRKLLIRISNMSGLDQAQLNEGDMVRVEMILPRAEFVHWPKHRRRIERWCEQAKVRLCGIKAVELLEKAEIREGLRGSIGSSPRKILKSYGRARGIDPDLMEIGTTILRE